MAAGLCRAGQVRWYITYACPLWSATRSLAHGVDVQNAAPVHMLECPNAVFTIRHLPSILGFLDFVERQREELTAPAWQARYGLAWQRIVEGIRPKFTDAQIAEAAAIAEAHGDRLALPTAFLTTLATP
ncbi:hypothetical protein [Streptomyces sp. NPDC085665]|uniref:hypothetical protein n=1 Tax=Streptomyces sp. NPDC085665 TaxID=3365735 RepID=UPI0037D46C69